MEESKAYNLGKVVKLKSGGPDMTITSLDKALTGDDFDEVWTGSYICSWFSGAKLDSGSFPHDSLVVESQD